MKVHALNLNTEHFVIEHLLDSSVNRQLVEGFVVPNNAHGLESYLKLQAEGDEKNSGSRTFLIKDAATGKLACYFSLRTGLIAVQREDGVQCLYIYALPKERLIQYYTSLGFMRLPSDAESFVYSHVKPAYDRGCIFMYQGI